MGTVTPTAAEINPIPESLDGKCAVENFEGKSLVQAEKLFAENGLYYSGNLLWMGPIGFMFYFKAALAYLKSEVSLGDPDFLNLMIGTLELRILGEYSDYTEIRNGSDDFIEFCKHAIENYNSYELDKDIYSDLCPNLRRLLAKLENG
jgi:hypothetical protein